MEIFQNRDCLPFPQLLDPNFDYEFYVPIHLECEPEIYITEEL